MKTLKLVFFLCFLTITNHDLTAQTPNNLPSTGNVGIGTSSPTVKLQISGKVMIDSAVTVKDTLRLMKDLIIDENVLINGFLKIASLTGNSVESAYLDENGQVVRGNSSLTLQQVYQFECPTDLLGNIIPLPPHWQAIPNIMFIMESECVEDVKVGIGLDAPLSRLHVVDKDNQLRPLFRVNTEGTPDNCFIILHNGNVGIGLPAPTAKIEVKTTGSDDLIRLSNAAGTQFLVTNNGHVFAREMKVTLNTIPDYVFENNYKLMSISELKNYIAKHHHLPNVPGQDHVDQYGGIDLGSFSSILLEKIEETTLYAIQLSEENRSLKNELEKTKQELKAVQNEIAEIRSEIDFLKESK